MSKITFDEAVQRFIEKGEAKWTDRTLEMYVDQLRRFSKYINGSQKHIENVSLYKDILSYRRQMVHKGLAPGSINLAMISLRQLYRLLETTKGELKLELPFVWGAIPVKYKYIPRSHRAIKPEEFRTILQAVDDGGNVFRITRDIAILRLLYRTGVRVSELCELNMSSVNLAEQTILVTTKKRRDRVKHRTVPFTRDAANALSAYFELRKVYTGSDALFVNLKTFDRLGIRSIQRLVSNYAAKAGLDPSNFKPHSFRHGFGQRGAKSEMYPPILSDLMGHTSLAGTKVYYNIENTTARREYHRCIGDREELVEKSRKKRATAMPKKAGVVDAPALSRGGK